MNNKVNPFLVGIFFSRVTEDIRYDFILSYLLKIRTEMLYLKFMILYLTMILFMKFQIDTLNVKIQWWSDVIRLRFLWFLSDFTTIGALKIEFAIKNILAYWQGFGDGFAIGILIALAVYFMSSRKTT